jgi:hypothetical protein
MHQDHRVVPIKGNRAIEGNGSFTTSDRLHRIQRLHEATTKNRLGVVPLAGLLRLAALNSGGFLVFATIYGYTKLKTQSWQSFLGGTGAH